MAKKEKSQFVLAGMKNSTVRKLLQPGTWLRIGWSDVNPTVALVLQQPGKRSGDLSILCYYPEYGAAHAHAKHTQVLEISTEPLVVPGDDRSLLLAMARTIEKRAIVDPRYPTYGESRAMMHGRELLGQALQYVC